MSMFFEILFVVMFIVIFLKVLGFLMWLKSLVRVVVSRVRKIEFMKLFL